MTSKSVTKMSNTTFSYAQAAKGHTVIQSSPQPTLSPAPPSTSSQGRDDATTATNSVTAPSITSNDSDVRDTGKLTQSEGESTLTKQSSDIAPITGDSAHAEPNPPIEQPSPALANGETAPIELVQDLPRSASQTSRSASDVDARKVRKSKKSKNSDKDTDADKDQEEEKEMEPAKLVLLSEAPIPAVNIWQKRREALAAKGKPGPVTSSSAAAVATIISSEEPKRRSTVEGIDTLGAPQNGANGEKSQRKSADFSRAAEQVPRRSGPRGARTGESVPSVSDSASWPDPKSAATSEEGKRKPLDKVERLDKEKEGQDETGPGKRQKEKWVSIPYVPTVNFQTPIPQRGSKPRGGARGGRDAGGRGGHSSAVTAGNASATSPATDKAPAAAGATVAKEGRPRESSGPTRATSLPPNASKRASTDSTYTRELRKPSAPTGAERTRDSTIDPSASGSGKGENTRSSRSEFVQGNGEPPQYSARPSFTDRRVDPAGKGFDGFKEGGPSAAKDQAYPPRERGEGRGERSRGGFRGRGGHNNSVGGHPPLSGYPPSAQYAVQNLPGPQHGPYSPPPHQNAFGNSFGSAPARGGVRGNGRANSGSTGFSRGPTNGGGPASRLPHVNTNIGAMDYPMHPYGGYQYPPTFYDPSTIQLLMLQVEYYLSVDNLCKDFFIRKRMDSKGFVPLTVISNFNRMRDLAPDIEAIRAACEQSDKIDYIVGDDNVERLRLRERWDRFVLNLEEREEDARNDGPVNWVFKSKHSRASYSAPMMPTAPYMATSPTIYPSNFPAEDQMYQPAAYMNGGHYEPGVNGGETNGHRYAMDSQLSATVPEFSPSGPGPFTLESVTTFSDKQVEDLKVLVGYNNKKDAPNLDSQAHPAVNGAVDTADHAQVNGGSVSPLPADVSSHPAQQGDATEPRSPTNSHRNVIWAKQQKAEVSEPEEEPYPVFRKKALEQRQFAKSGETPRAMKNLYEFWSHFLIGGFNAKMYEEFRICAIEDASKESPSKDGLRCLVHYYKELFSRDAPKPWGSDRPIPEIFTLHYQGALMLDPNLSTNGDVGV